MDYFNIEKDFVKINLNPKLYDLETIYSTAYQLIEDTYIYVDGDPEKKITVNLSYKNKSKNKENELSLLAKNFRNELVNNIYSKLGSKKKEFLKVLLLKKSFGSINLEDYDDEVVCEECDKESSQETSDSNGMEKLEEDISEDDFEDPEGIAIPWDEKHGDENKELSESQERDDENDSKLDEEATEEDLNFEDPEGIAIPWDENEESNTCKDEEDTKLEEKATEDDLDFEDPENITIPWDEEDDKDSKNKD